MSITSSDRISGPFTGNDVTTALPFTFKVFLDSDLQVLKRITATGVESELVLTTDYTVTLNANQDANPGGTVTLNVALPTGSTAFITSDIAVTQPTDITNQGGFYPKVITDALDRATIQIQQLSDDVDRSIKIPATDTTTTDLPSSVDRASRYFIFDENGAITVSTSSADVQLILDNKASVDAVAGDIANVNTVATDITNVNTVATNLSIINDNAVNIGLVGDDIANVNTVATDITNVNTVATNIANVNTVAGLGLLDGWFDSADTWVYASATTFTIVGSNVVDQFPVGTKIKLTNAGVKYFYVVSASFGGGNTTVTVTGGSDYSLANSAITLPSYSYSTTPQGFPNTFNWTPTFTGVTLPVDPAEYTLACTFSIVGNRVHFEQFLFMLIGGSTSSATNYFTLPVAEKGEGYVGALVTLGVCEFEDQIRGDTYAGSVVLRNNATTASWRYHGVTGTKIETLKYTTTQPISYPWDAWSVRSVGTYLIA